MKVTKSQWSRYQRKLSAISTKASSEMLSWITSQGGFTAIEFESAIAKAYVIATKYGEASASLSALMYDAMAEASGANVASAVVADTATVGEVSKAIYGGATYSQNDEYISNIVGRLVKQAGADTTLKNAKRDGAEFAWIAQGDTCSYCELISAMGWQYASAKTIKGDHADHIHANCDCQFMIRFDNTSSVEGYEPNTSLYDNLEGNTLEEKVNTLRRQNYAENKDEINEQKRIAYAKRTDSEE